MPKSDPTLPDNWKVTIFYLDGKMDEFEVVGQHLFVQDGYWKFDLTNDAIRLVYVHSIRGIAFDENYRAVLEAKARAEAEAKAKQPT